MNKCCPKVALYMTGFNFFIAILAIFVAPAFTSFNGIIWRQVFSGPQDTPRVLQHIWEYNKLEGPSDDFIIRYPDDISS